MDEGWLLLAALVYSFWGHDFPFMAWLYDWLAKFFGYLAWVTGRMSIYARVKYYEVI